MIVVTGSTGNVGRPLVQTLAAAGQQVTAVSRGAFAQDLPSGVIHQQADLAEPSTLKPALDGADALYLLIAGGGEGLDAGALLDTARSAGVSRVVLQSSQGVATRPAAASHAHLREFEDAVRTSGLEWTVLRPGGFASNAFAWAGSVREQRTIAAPFGDVGLPLIDPADIAAAAAAVLTETGHSGRAYELTGPAPVSPRQQAAAIAAALGEPVRFHELSRSEARAFMGQFMPEHVVDGTLDILGRPTPGEQRESPAVEQLTGRPAGTFADWAVRHAGAFA